MSFQVVFETRSGRRTPSGVSGLTDHYAGVDLKTPAEARVEVVRGSVENAAGEIACEDLRQAFDHLLTVTST